MIDFVFGKKNNPVAVDNLVKCLSHCQDVEGTLYIGYPMFESSDHAMLTDALLITKNYGVVIFDLNHLSEPDDEKIRDYQDELY
uniref:hypothetical protein n=1 Tax=Aeromonas hydrophila TaxID=644 RepID=UPI003F66C532